MPEGDTVFAAAARLRQGLEGRTLISTQFRIPSLATADLSGRTVVGVRSKGKHLLIDVEESEPGAGDAVSIHSHLKMEGVWHVHRRGQKWRRPSYQARVVLRTDDHEAVGFDLGTLELLADPDAALAYLGPDLLADDFDRDEAIRRLGADPEQTIGAALLDQRLMAGVGNVFRSEICYLRGVLPSRPVGDVDLGPMVDLSRRLLWANRMRSARTTTGNTSPNARMWVYGRNGQLCRRCATIVKRGELASTGGERSVYWCPRCQS
ncbi:MULTISPECIES: DNA-formamidopyrimidine glycosylase family protein [Gordonia]|uniref:DNA-(apurinic or apyrimidinic site) lyase n=1 Tax=Gordonia amicalis TaxID=89053 RepID=A0AAE4R0L9_9ACTN|nr:MULTISPECIES: DNA-formamidopyrimidine glycosylase family protein [Gordonia]ATD70320.1 Fpg/Nei family DNA glycosylase [Gordonia sp. 1D]MBA5846375.1 Fpg/Nei family DNA glycosylase [Gordonia amicalis]MCZ4651982.1 Fpg/Nei family DNA glycosylase [Gordonia amicalis]MDJ0452768.1 DNA-formamidopyrimidine glycosylase family protein [Gordonia amicalis]MDV6310071.1 DNA-formamidopyrimidine glycosylase family protein [Gordonia amicalis]